MIAGSDLSPRKSLGQHWLSDSSSLQAITDLANLSKSDTVLEIGPGKGSLTKMLCQQVKEVIAVELDNKLANHLETLKILNLKVVNADILSFNFENLVDYKVVANIPYYLTGKIIKLISEARNRPSLVVLLVQKEIAVRLSADPGQLSILGLTCQYYWQVDKGQLISKDKFDPPPKVDSQIVKLTPKKLELSEPERVNLFRTIRIGFSSKRKTILNNLASGLRADKKETERILRSIDIDPLRRPQTLSLDEWIKLSKTTKSASI